MNLCFHDDSAAAEPLGHGLRVGRVHDSFPFGHWHTVLRKNLLRLILVNFHMWETVNRIIFYYVAAAPFVHVKPLRIEFTT